jgi:translation initiation factor 5B
MRAQKGGAGAEELRSPICCILGHVDAGKTRLLDNIRRTSVREGEAGGITQQIGATYVPKEAIERRTSASASASVKLPGLLFIDTPGHASFRNLRQRGSGLCDIAVLVVDIVHGLEQQTVESIGMLKARRTPFLIALNKVDRLYGWKCKPDSPIRESLRLQKDGVAAEFERRSSQAFLQLNELGLNVALYWKNADPRRVVSVVPTSALSGEGIPDLLLLTAKLTHTMMAEKLRYVSDATQCSVLEVGTAEGLGTTLDCVLVNGSMREGDRIVVCTLGGAVVTRIKALKTPMPLRDMRVHGKGQQMVDHKEIRAAMGVRLVAPGLEQAVAGTRLFVVRTGDDEAALREAVMEDMAEIFDRVDKGDGVCVQASTLGSLEALLAFLADSSSSSSSKIPVASISLGAVHKRDVMKASVMQKKYAVILAFDVPVSKEARALAEELGVEVFAEDVIYRLFDRFTDHMRRVRSAEQEAASIVAVFPCVLRIVPNRVFHAKDPIVLGVEVVEGIAKVGAPLCVPTKSGLDLGRIASMELDHKPVDTVRAGESVAMKIESTNASEAARLYGRHFDSNDPLVSRISRDSIDALKAHLPTK